MVKFDGMAALSVYWREGCAVSPLSTLAIPALPWRRLLDEKVWERFRLINGGLLGAYEEGSLSPDQCCALATDVESIVVANQIIEYKSIRIDETTGSKQRVVLKSTPARIGAWRLEFVAWLRGAATAEAVVHLSL